MKTLKKVFKNYGFDYYPERGVVAFEWGNDAVLLHLDGVGVLSDQIRRANNSTGQQCRGSLGYAFSFALNGLLNDLAGAC